MIKTHELKTHSLAFKAIKAGTKVHEVRCADRDYAPGDTVILREWNEDTEYTGDSVTKEIGYVTYPGQWGLPAGVCVFSLLPRQT